MKIWVALRKESRTSLGLDIARPCAPVGPPTDFDDFASRGMFGPSWSACGAGVRAPRLRPYLRLHLLQPCQYQTINSSRSSQTSFSAKLAARAGTLFITLLFCWTARTAVYRACCVGGTVVRRTHSPRQSRDLTERQVGR